jgi:eukaryotic translation initiation factor 2C
VPELRRAFRNIDEKYRPKLTLIVVQKQHNIRIMPENVLTTIHIDIFHILIFQINPGARPADQNIKPGTVIDQYIVNPVFTEFYLNSHRANQV